MLGSLIMILFLITHWHILIILLIVIGIIKAILEYYLE